MSKTARMIMYPLLLVVVGFFVYTMFFMQPKEDPKTEGTEPATEQVETSETTDTGK